MNCQITSSEKQQTADQAPDQQTCSRPDTNVYLAGNKTKLNMSFNKCLIAQEVRREIDHLQKTKIIVLSGTNKATSCRRWVPSTVYLPKKPY